jgi:folate-binding protein YgfZ
VDSAPRKVADQTEQARAEEALLAGRAAVWLAVDVVRVAGPDATSFLQGQLSQDVGPLAEGGSAVSLVLQPTGKVDALARVSRTGPDEFLLDTEGGFGDALVARLRKFKLRVKAEVDPVPGWRCLRMLGARPASEPGAAGLEVATGWPTLPGVDRLGPDPAIPDGVELGEAGAYEPLRILAGVPRLGAELTERTIPAEAGIIDLTVSFTKGCYTGQELVARIDSRGGHVPRHLCRLLAEPGPVPPAGAVIEVDGRAAGEVTSAAYSASRGTPVALGYVRRDVPVPGPATLRWAGGELSATVEPRA